MKLEKYKKPALIGAITIFFLLALIFSKIDKVYDAVNRIGQENPRFFNTAKSIIKLSDIPFKLVSLIVPDKLPQYRLEINSQDLNKLKSNLPSKEDKLTSEYKKEIPATFTFQGQKYPVTVRFRGDNANHWAYVKKSWRINFIETPFKGFESINLIFVYSSLNISLLIILSFFK